jgi:AraC-like DNA-binding protein
MPTCCWRCCRPLCIFAKNRTKRRANSSRGGFLVAEHQAHMMLVQALRLHLSEPLEGQTGWLAALADKPISLVINAMHQDPARRWTLQDLAERAGMSRSSFALKFRATADETPMTYLTRWRMLLAGD